MFFRILGKNVIYITLIVACFLTSCSSQKSSFSDKNKSTLRINLCDDPLSWDPRCVRLIKDISLISHLFEGLTRRNKIDKIENGLAEKITLSEDKKIYTIYLKKAFWSNGETITANDFKASWLQVLKPDFPSFYAHFMDIIKNGKNIRLQKMGEDNFGVKILSDQIFTIELEKPYPYFKELLSLPIFFPVHESLRKSTEENKTIFPLVSNGAFKLIYWQPKFNIKLEKNSCYWESSEINLKFIDMSIISDNATEVLLFKKKCLDWLGQPWSSNVLSEARDKLSSENLLKSYDVAGTFWLLINTNIPPLNNTKLRQALSLSLNRESIVKYILKGNQSKTISVLPKSLSSLPENFLNTQVNLVLAKKLFEEALEELNLTVEKIPQITLIYPSSNSRCAAIAQEIQYQWKKHLNLFINLQGFEYRFFLEKRNQGDYQISTADWIADFVDPLSFLQILSDNSQQKYSQWKNNEFSSLINEAEKEMNDEKRHQLIQKAEKILLKELPVLPLYHYSFDYALPENVKGVIFYSSGAVNLNYVTIN